MNNSYNTVRDAPNNFFFPPDSRSGTTGSIPTLLVGPGSIFLLIEFRGTPEFVVGVPGLFQHRFSSGFNLIQFEFSIHRQYRRPVSSHSES